MTAINHFADFVIHDPAVVVCWRQEDLKEADIGTTELLTIHGVSFKVERTQLDYTAARKREEVDRTASKNFVQQEEQNLQFYVSRKAESHPLML